MRKEREIDIKERLNEERTAEYIFKQKELNQRLKDAITWPLNCLDNEARLADKLRDVKLTPEFYRFAGGALSDEGDSDRNILDFINREENKQFLRDLKATGSEEVRLKGEGLLKFEYVVLKERARNIIVKDYLESELKTVQSERVEASKDRERYLQLSDAERQLQEEKKLLDQHKMEYQSLSDNLKKNISLANDLTFFYNSAGMKDGILRDASPTNGNLILDGGGSSVFDSAMHKTSNLISTYILSPSKTMTALN